MSYLPPDHRDGAAAASPPAASGRDASRPHAAAGTAGASVDARLQAYAELLVEVGVNLQPGQGLLIRAAIEAAPLVRVVAGLAYRLGSPLVDVMWSDDEVTRARFEHAPDGSFETVPQWRADGRLTMFEQGFASLAIVGDDPDLLAGTDPERWASYVRVWQQATRPSQAISMRNGVAWCVAAYPGLAWARKVTPGVSDEQAVAALWDAIFLTCRVDGPDPVAAWRQHSQALKGRAARLNERRYAALHFRGPGTDLRVGLAEGHLWAGGSSQTPDGRPFIPNIPTEEIFTAPHRQRLDGVVRASMPLASGGSIIDDFSMRFEGGRVVQSSAGRGQQELTRILESDDGARSLGEVALVPASSPIARTGLLYFETLFDENAASHIALGKAYPTSVEGGAEMSEAEVAAAGLNDSITHVDFMIGSAEMDVDGVRQDGSDEPLMRGGEWVD